MKIVAKVEHHRLRTGVAFQHSDPAGYGCALRRKGLAVPGIRGSAGVYFHRARAKMEILV